MTNVALAVTPAANVPGASVDAPVDRPGSAWPRVTIGLPVYNGERFLADAVESVLQQTFTDFELVICDNASTDRTPEIIESYARRDPRIRHVRNAVNIGAAANFNAAFELGRAPYFKWMAHDDLCAPDFLRRCVEALDRDPAVVLCFPRQLDIDDHGNVVSTNVFPLDTRLTSPHQRFAEIMRFWRGAPGIWGLTRRDVLRRTGLIQDYYASDLVLLAELALHGRFAEVPEDLLLHREHAGRSVYSTDRYSVTTWLNPLRRRPRRFPFWSWFGGYVAAVSRSPLPFAERLRCWAHLARWFRWRWREAVDDVVHMVAR
jgi:glycosyltransferase involved in cell wall biosynthesis